MADDIIQFAPGGKVTAEETNANNLLLKEWALDNSELVQVINQVNSLSNSVTTAQNTANSAQSTANTALSTANSRLWASFNNGGNGYCVFSNGFKVMWGFFGATTYTGNKTVTFPTPFASGNYGVTMLTGPGQVDGAWLNSYQITSKTSSNFTFYKGMTEVVGAYWIAAGY